MFPLFESFYILILAGFVGFEVIKRVTPTLHTPLMSATNAISGISLSRFTCRCWKRSVCQSNARTRRGDSRYNQRRWRIYDHRTNVENVQTEGAETAMINYPLEITYIIASVLFIMGLKGLGHPESARRGMHYAEIGMLMAVVGTLLGQNIVTWQWILIGLVIGSAIGTAMAIFMPMTAMPQRIAISHAFGALAAVLVGINEFIIKGSEIIQRTYGSAWI